MDYKKLWKKTWYFIWESDSILSWIVNIILAFVIIKFLIYPGLGFIMQTSYPVVAVVSGSMEHKAVHPCSMRTMQGSCIERDTSHYEICGIDFEEKQKNSFYFFWNTCNNWYKENTIITKDKFEEFKFKNGFNTGDIMVLRGINPEKIEIGDTIVYMSKTAPYPIIHRVVDIKENTFITKGDHNSGADAPVEEKQIIGKATLRIPLLGWIKIGFVKLINVFMGV
jgi:signal peptidase I